jgi:chorismate lyase/3-hydroxybenzoate synthase
VNGTVNGHGRPLELRLGTAAALADGLAADASRVLLVVRYGESGAAPLPVPAVELPNRVLAGPPVEAWLARRPVERFRLGALSGAEDGQVLLGCLSTELEPGLEAETREHFALLLEALESRGYPHLLRVWNYLPGINGLEAGTERYRLFNLGRAAAFEARYGAEKAECRYPASSAVGAPGGALVTCFAAAREKVRYLENPRQMRAYHYPPEHGPKAPSFSRASVANGALARLFFLSGTASIVGHVTLHAGQLAAQLDETLRNIGALVASAASPAGRPPRRWQDFDYLKVYVRDAADLGVLREALAAAGGPVERTTWLAADICRADLLLEIEGVALG